MRRFHFVEDYQREVKQLIAKYPLDQAMSVAVGGAYAEIGAVERDILLWTGLMNGMSLVDFGCGSGRLAHTVSKSLDIQYTGIDVVKSLLDYASARCPASYKFSLNHALTLPCTDGSADFITAFSVFTHLLPSESYLYLADFRRVLRPDGIVIFSFLEFADDAHWSTFMDEVTCRFNGDGNPLITLLERQVICKWCSKLGYSPTFIDSSTAPWGSAPLGQAVAVLRPTAVTP